MLRPTFLSFETAKKALSASQYGLDTVGHNISNVNTPGYTRQRVDQVSISPTGYRSKFQIHGSQGPGMGSEVQGISQVRDPFLDNRYRTEAANYGELSIKSNALMDLVSVFDEIMKDGLWSQFGELINALDKFKDNVTSEDMATVVRNYARQLTQVMNKNASELETILKQQYSDLSVSVGDINSIVEQVARLNELIMEDHFYGVPSNELMDQRNLLLDQLSEYLDITVEYTSTTVGDRKVQQCNVYINGLWDSPLISSGSYNQLKLEPSIGDGGSQSLNDWVSNADGCVSLSLIDGVSGLAVKGVSDLTPLFETGQLGGALGGYVQVINGDGIYSSDGSSFRGVAYYRKALDELAVQFAQVMNGLNTPSYDNHINSCTENIARLTEMINAETALASPDNEAVAQWEQERMEYLEKLNGFLPIDDFSLADTPGFDWDNIATAGSGALLIQNGQAQEVVQTLDNDGEIVSLLLGATDLAPELAQGRRYLFVGAGNDPSVITAKTITISEEWVKDAFWMTTNLSPTVDGGEDSNHGDNIARFYYALNSQSYSFANGFSGTCQEFLVGMQSDLSLDKQLNNTLADASFNVISGIIKQRDAVSAVSTDEEAINMIIYQNYYNAAARYMTVLDEALGTIIQGMGVVGR